jgi:hypothetical protein
MGPPFLAHSRASLALLSTHRISGVPHRYLYALRQGLPRVAKTPSSFTFAPSPTPPSTFSGTEAKGEGDGEGEKPYGEAERGKS